ncbi:MAG: aminomethyltransferase family protein [Burkholderiales bacterium]
MTSSAFSQFLATRSAAGIDVAPGITTPQYFSGAEREHLATRRAAGLFDFSFMGCVEIAGAGSLDFLHCLQTRSLTELAHGRIAYTLLLRDDASVMIDATVWHLERDHYWLFVGRRRDCAEIMQAAGPFAVAVKDLSSLHAVLAIQGSASRGIIERAFGQTCLPALPYFGFKQFDFSGHACWLARLGYSGETGYELVIADAAAPALWQALLTAGEGAGLLECGFDAIDTLRIEAGHILFTHELTSGVSPAELGMTRRVDFYGRDFRGAQALQAQRWRTPSRRLVGLLPENYAAMDVGNAAHINAGGAIITSVCRSPLFNRELALGFVHTADACPGSLVRLPSGARASVTRLPFYDPARALPRRVV